MQQGPAAAGSRRCSVGCGCGQAGRRRRRRPPCASRRSCAARRGGSKSRRRGVRAAPPRGATATRAAWRLQEAWPFSGGARWGCQFFWGRGGTARRGCRRRCCERINLAANVREASS
eukprot:364283-Chlamydomonas_euryale.AAC.26